MKFKCVGKFAFYFLLAFTVYVTFSKNFVYTMKERY